VRVAQLLSHLRALSDSVLTRLREAEEQARPSRRCSTGLRSHPLPFQLEALEHDAALGDVAATAETLRFNALSNTQFVENVRGAAHSTPSPCALGLTPRFPSSQRLYDDGHAVVLKRCGANDAASRGGAQHAPQTEPEARWRRVLSHAPLRCSLSFLALYPPQTAGHGRGADCCCLRRCVALGGWRGGQSGCS
jgi:hypothetical protein